ncbi:hypothetical protein, no similarity [Maudiozyma barnettii]|uniref:Uncharacterized protein n=1 Tax=Maudiozyma barnettii TaxID=61262 RepID=A0A8H2VK75_9SACH|nr:hypothetical protein, no similarity [Kazachstania barnettii]CAB4256932.1 hypothetical protein, no similarity [Kazachstania barnettii]CAD1785537.1 hypothetical protein, no similarity [Kazachstania barnettii]
MTMPTLMSNTNIEQLVQLIDQFMEDLDAPLEPLIKLFRISCNKIGYPIIKNSLDSIAIKKINEYLNISPTVCCYTNVFQSLPRTTKRRKPPKNTGWMLYNHQDNQSKTGSLPNFENKNSTQGSYLSSLFSVNTPNGNTERTTIHESEQNSVHMSHKPQMDKNEKYKVLRILYHSKNEESTIKKELTALTKKHKFRRWKNKYIKM